ncbi:hypothetical protein [Pararhodobacter sp.]|nr:hypothetical protein [Pararhodobacter sp.]
MKQTRLLKIAKVLRIVCGDSTGILIDEFSIAEYFDRVPLHRVRHK